MPERTNLHDQAACRAKALKLADLLQLENVRSMTDEQWEWVTRRAGMKMPSTTARALPIEIQDKITTQDDPFARFD